MGQLFCEHLQEPTKAPYPTRGGASAVRAKPALGSLGPAINVGVVKYKSFDARSFRPICGPELRGTPYLPHYFDFRTAGQWAGLDCKIFPPHVPAYSRM